VSADDTASSGRIACPGGALAAVGMAGATRAGEEVTGGPQRFRWVNLPIRFESNAWNRAAASASASIGFAILLTPLSARGTPPEIPPGPSTSDAFF
jgi:hypothetical protein